MRTSQIFLGFLATICLLFSTAASWSLILYDTMDDCTCTDGPCRRQYVSYEGTAQSACITPCLDAANASYVYTNDGGSSFKACIMAQAFAAFAVGQGTTCDWGVQERTGAGSFTQSDEGMCYDETEYLGLQAF